MCSYSTGTTHPIEQIEVVMKVLLVDNLILKLIFADVSIGCSNPPVSSICKMNTHTCTTLCTGKSLVVDDLYHTSFNLCVAEWSGHSNGDNRESHTHHHPALPPDTFIQRESKFTCHNYVGTLHFAWSVSVLIQIVFQHALSWLPSISPNVIIHDCVWVQLNAIVYWLIHLQYKLIQLSIDLSTSVLLSTHVSTIVAS